ncbi:MAG: amidohydrolase [Candidatus Cyclonatronum sp.]|uniref:amidohydrolase n=1 Tax=Cyclonatronum sp. TaxID=3024185 RepID=UPI0025BA8501|nr:amidohydrolase [Cyclonatronum sp.]MCH8487814.1 amidohydrolase [Cyclonatronum sp.]
MIPNPEAFTQQHLPRWIEMRRRLHQLAEVSGEEVRTAAQIAEWLEKTGPDELHTGLGGCGIIAVYGPESAPKRVMLRAELDGLPIADPPEWDHRAENPQAGHKCGHDGHMMNLVALAEYLGAHPPKNLRVILVFQQAEETGIGAARIIETEVFRRLKPDVIFALHNLPGYPKHSIVLKSGVFASASTGLIVRLKGATSHAAHPNDGTSPGPALAQLMQLFPAIPGQYLPVQEQGLITVIHARLGEIAFGTAPGEAVLMATFRAPETRTVQNMLAKARQLAAATARTHSLEVEFDTTEVFEASVNEPELCRLAEQIAEKQGLKVIRKDQPFMWSEDFGRFSSYGPTLLFGLGAGKEHPQLHSRAYDFPDELLETGVRMLAELLFS